MEIRFKHFHDSLKTVVILAHGRELLSAKSAQFPVNLIFAE